VAAMRSRPPLAGLFSVFSPGMVVASTVGCGLVGGGAGLSVSVPTLHPARALHARSAAIGSWKRHYCGELAAADHARASAPIPNRRLLRATCNSLLTASPYRRSGRLSECRHHMVMPADALTVEDISVGSSPDTAKPRQQCRDRARQ